MQPNKSNESLEVLGLDIGDARIGIARANTIAKLPEPVAVIATNESSISEIINILSQNSSQLIVVGLPLTASGQDSEQTTKVRQFVAALKKQTDLDCVFVDESYSSIQADAVLTDSKLSHSSNDAIAACVILERYFSEGIVT